MMFIGNSLLQLQKCTTIYLIHSTLLYAYIVVTLSIVTLKEYFCIYFFYMLCCRRD